MRPAEDAVLGTGAVENASLRRLTSENSCILSSYKSSQPGEQGVPTTWLLQPEDFILLSVLHFLKIIECHHVIQFLGSCLKKPGHASKGIFVDSWTLRMETRAICSVSCAALGFKLQSQGRTCVTIQELDGTLKTSTQY